MQVRHGGVLPASCAIPLATIRLMMGQAHSRDEPPPPPKKKRRRSDEDGPLARMYMKQAREEDRRDRLRAREAGGWGRDSVGGGWTMFGVTLTAGVVTGGGMLLTGLLAFPERAARLCLVALPLALGGLGVAGFHVYLGMTGWPREN